MERIWSNDEPDDHHLRLPGARSVVTGEALITKENLAQVIKLQGILCLYGEAGVGKTFLTRGVLRELAPVSTFWVRFRAHPYPRDIREALFESLGMAGPVPRRAGQFDRLILQQLRGEFRVLVCDEAQWLSAECFELWRFLWDDKDTKIVLVFVGGHNCYKVLRSKPMLASRVTIWQELQRLSREEIATVIPAFHPVWAQVDPADLAFVDTRAAHGNFRMWVTITRLTLEALDLFDQPRVDRRVLEWVFSKLGGSP